LDSADGSPHRQRVSVSDLEVSHLDVSYLEE
jgi:hypothetical protein